MRVLADFPFIFLFPLRSSSSAVGAARHSAILPAAAGTCFFLFDHFNTGFVYLFSMFDCQTLYIIYDDRTK